MIVKIPKNIVKIIQAIVAKSAVSWPRYQIRGEKWRPFQAWKLIFPLVCPLPWEASILYNCAPGINS